MMKSFRIAALFLLFAVCSLSAPADEDRGEGSLRVAEASICIDVVDRKPVKPGMSFPSTVGKLFCFTRILGAEGPSHVTHVWFYGNRERARVELPVNSPNWRTYSSKKILSQEIGAWQVEVLGPQGETLYTLQFDIIP